MSYDVLIVDDEADIREIVSGILVDENYTARVAADGVTALELIKQRQPNLVILDVWLGDGERDGIRILDIIKRDHPYVPVVMISGHSTIETAVSAIKKGAYDFIEKPFKTERLLLVVERAIESSKLRRENDELRVKARLSSPVLVGNSNVVQTLRHSIQKLADTTGRVFITGPIGAGKEMVAREIHNQSKRSNGTFVSINCGSLHPNKLEAELFGTEIMNHDPAQPRKIGLLEQVYGGTLYFDEIHLLPLPFQSKLVKILHEQAFSRIGGDEKIPMDVRILAGTSSDIHERIKNGDFREDLYYRMCVAQLTVPALKDRAVDLPLIVQKLMDEAAAASGLKPRKFSEDAMIMMQSYSWPGDLIQLRNMIDWLLIMTCQDSNDPIIATQLPHDIINGNTFSSNWQNKSADIVVLPLREAREAFEREYLITQVNRFAGNISQTARFVGMERSALHRKLRALKVHDPRSVDDDPYIISTSS